MATTDARAGFRLPWSTDRQSGEHADGEAGADQQDTAASAWPSEDNMTSMATPTETTDDAALPPRSSPTPAPATPPPSARKPSKFMADLTKAMQAAAEDARSRALTQLQADAKTQVETIHGRSSTDAAGLRRNADDDVAAVREWSKGEIARIREETEARITDRKACLETEIEGHAGMIEREIDAVQKTVAAFEADMAEFFERLLAEGDPSRFATMAENLPEPPSFDDIVATPAAAFRTESAVEAAAAVVVEPVAHETSDTVVTDGVPADAPLPDATSATDQVDREAAFAAIQASAEAAAHDDDVDAAATDVDDPRLSALGPATDLDTAEAEAFEAAGSSDEDIPEIADDAVAARIAGLVPDKDAAAGAVATQVVVVGLVSVASIASFKRHLGRLPGVHSVGVSSGPDGEFVFAVSHGSEVTLRDAIPSLPSFQARVTGSADDVVHVTAHDPESDA